VDHRTPSAHLGAKSKINPEHRGQRNTSIAIERGVLDTKGSPVLGHIYLGSRDSGGKPVRI